MALDLSKYFTPSIPAETSSEIQGDYLSKYFSTGAPAQSAFDPDTLPDDVGITRTKTFMNPMNWPAIYFDVAKEGIGQILGADYAVVKGMSRALAGVVGEAGKQGDASLMDLHKAGREAFAADFFDDMQTVAASPLFKPWTESGEIASDAIGSMFAWMSGGVDKAADTTLEATNNPELAGLVKATGEALIVAASYILPGRKKIPLPGTYKEAQVQWLRTRNPDFPPASKVPPGFAHEIDATLKRQKGSDTRFEAMQTPVYIDSFTWKDVQMGEDLFRDVLTKEHPEYSPKNKDNMWAEYATGEIQKYMADISATWNTDIKNLSSPNYEYKIKNKEFQDYAVNQVSPDLYAREAKMPKRDFWTLTPTEYALSKIKPTIQQRDIGRTARSVRELEQKDYIDYVNERTGEKNKTFQEAIDAAFRARSDELARAKAREEEEAFAQITKEKHQKDIAAKTTLNKYMRENKEAQEVLEKRTGDIQKILTQPKMPETETPRWRGNMKDPTFRAYAKEKKAISDQEMIDEFFEARNDALLSRAARNPIDAKEVPMGQLGAFKSQRGSLNINEIVGWFMKDKSKANAKKMEVTQKPLSERGRYTKGQPLISRKDEGILRTLENILLPKLNPLKRLNEPIGEAPYSAALKYITDAIHYPKFGSQKTLAPDAMDIMNAKDIMTARFRSKLEAATAKFGRNMFRGVSSTQGIGKASSERVLALLRGYKNADKRSTKAEREMATNIRAVLDELYQYASKAIPDLGYTRNWVPRYFKPEKYPQLEAILRKHMPEERVRDIMDKLILEDAGIFEKGQRQTLKDIIDSRGNSAPRATSLYERKLKEIPDEVLKDVLDNDLFQVLDRAIHEITNEVEYTKRFGRNNEILNRKVYQAMKEMDLAFRKGEVERPLTTGELQSLLDMAYTSKHGVAPGGYISKAMRNYMRYGGAIANMQLLGQVVLSSLPEVGNMLALFIKNPKNVLVGTMKGVVNQIPSMARSVSYKIPETQIDQLNRLIGRGGPAMAVRRMLGNYSLGDAPTIIDQATFRLNFATYWNKLLNDVHAGIFVDEFHSMMKNTKPTKNQLAEMNEIANYRGWDINEMRAWYNRGMPQNDPVFDKFLNGLLISNRDTVLHGTPTNRPMYMSDDRYMAFKYLKTFPSLMSDRVLNRWYRELKVAQNRGNIPLGQKGLQLAIAAGAMYMIADWVNSIKDEKKYGGTNPKFRKAPWLRVYRNIDTAGLTGVGMYIWDSWTQQTWEKLPSMVVAPNALAPIKLTFSSANAFITGNTKPLARELAKMSKAIPFSGEEGIYPTQQEVKMRENVINNFLQDVIPTSQRNR